MASDPTALNPHERGLIRVKFMIRSATPDDPSRWLRRFPGGRPVWGGCHFIFDHEARDYDWLVAYDDLPPRPGERRSLRDEVLACPAQNTLLITVEPSSIKAYGNRFLSQFGHILTSQEPWAIHHPGVIRSQPALLWFYGYHVAPDDPRGDYDFQVAHPPLNKTDDISTVCSSKQMRHTLHHHRYQFVQKLSAAMPELQVFGHGVRALPDKSDALDRFRYHVAIENHVAPHHWTEKLADSFLGATLPFYHGCPNTADYFPEESVVPIDIFKFDESLATIQQAIRDRWYEKRLPAILEARRRVVTDYGLFATIDKIIRRTHTQRGPLSPTAPVHLKSRHLVRKASVANQLLDFYDKVRFRVKNR
jgi:hypothetical protein